MENQIHSELIMKEEQEDQDTGEETQEGRCSTESNKSVTPDPSAIGIRPKPLICKPENVSIGCKSEPIDRKWQWAPGAWQDATRTSAFQPYKVFFCTLLKWNICILASRFHLLRDYFVYVGKNKIFICYLQIYLSALYV